MTNEDAAREIFPVVMGESATFTDFRAVQRPADEPEPEVEGEEDEDPKGESAPSPVESSDSPKVIELTTKAMPVPPPAARVTSSPKEQSPGSQPS